MRTDGSCPTCSACAAQRQPHRPAFAVLCRPLPSPTMEAPSRQSMARKGTSASVDTPQNICGREGGSPGDGRLNTELRACGLHSSSQQAPPHAAQAGSALGWPDTGAASSKQISRPNSAIWDR